MFNHLQIIKKLLVKYLCSRCINITLIFTVPEQVPILTTSNAQKDSILLVWGPPLESNGILTGYLLQYHLSMYTHTMFYD